MLSLGTAGYGAVSPACPAAVRRPKADGNAMPMADAVVLATALEHGATLWTQDAHFKGIAGVKHFPKK